MAEAERRHGSDTVWNGRSRSGDWIKVHWAGAKQIWWTPKDQGVVPPALVRGCWSSCHGWHRSGLVNLKSQMCQLSFGLILVELLYLQQSWLLQCWNSGVYCGHSFWRVLLHGDEYSTPSSPPRSRDLLRSCHQRPPPPLRSAPPRSFVEERISH
ncbi:putative pre-mRNA-splicing factor ATP-dependent RNA helicase DEAH9 [Zea mays]|uniref:Putative pre-mRNA-splicing factor ATP-dependent RNA helicase DEAH9 n=1 Tax=Zea mays TaxID=4577 RepID=A0A1D6JBY1_MAIZE|nr:RNI-like superfamily protein [Zea mays]ONM28510.1 putative pre-mRNA-splicing factor ATP-dependent RNA helicase DEAH9 [Zea mays]